MNKTPGGVGGGCCLLLLLFSFVWFLEGFGGLLGLFVGLFFVVVVFL